MNQFIAPPMSISSIKHSAMEIRTLFGLKNVLFMPVVEVLEWIIYKLDDSFNYEYVSSSELPPNTYAYYDPINNTMKIHADVYDRACDGSGRDRFTIAHEIAHYFLLSNGVALARSSEEKIESCRDPEWQANTFASEFLMPEHLIANMTVDEIQQECGTSRQASEIAHSQAKSRVIKTRP